MNSISSPTPGVDAPLLKIPQDKSDKAIEAFEEMFVNEIFKSMRGASQSEGKSYGETTTLSLLDEEFAREIARADGLGLRAMLADALDE